MPALCLPQLVQFVVGGFFTFYSGFVPQCILSDDQRMALWACSSYVFALLILFTKFAMDTYCKPRSPKSKPE